MDMPIVSRAAVLNRLNAVIDLDGRPAPKVWGDLSVTERLLVEGQDPELAAVMKNQMDAALELAVLSGQWSDVAPAVKSQQELKDDAIAAAFAAMGTPRSIDELEAARNAALAEQAQARANSFVQAHGAWQ